VDFIYYIISRIRDDYAIYGDLDKSIQNALSTTGRAVFILGMTLCIGVMAWHNPKLMFQAQMGFLIEFVLILNLLNAIFLIPSLIAVLRPKFIMKSTMSK
jgi:predicted RND superfamily exporter protein